MQWLIPTQVDGPWRVEQGAALTLERAQAAGAVCTARSNHIASPRVVRRDGEFVTVWESI